LTTARQRLRGRPQANIRCRPSLRLTVRITGAGSLGRHRCTVRIAAPSPIRNRHRPDPVRLVPPKRCLRLREAAGRIVVVAFVEPQDVRHAVWPAGGVTEIACHPWHRQVPHPDHGDNQDNQSTARLIDGRAYRRAKRRRRQSPRTASASAQTSRCYWRACEARRSERTASPTSRPQAQALNARSAPCAPPSNACERQGTAEPQSPRCVAEARRTHRMAAATHRTHRSSHRPG
jgi:hypothetical protein